VTARYQDWLRQARRDLAHARRARDGGDYEWACFAAQQSAEKAVKAVFMRVNQVAWGHSVAALLQALPEPWQVDDAILDAGKELDKHYIPPRYPNSHPQGAPYDYYTASEAERAIEHTTAIIAFCERLLAECASSGDLPEGGSSHHGDHSSGD
jgi:HEPN domain-containing protein